MRTTARPSTSRPSAATAAYVPPVSNTGGTDKAEGWDGNEKAFAPVSESYEHVIKVGRNTKTIPLKRGSNGRGAFIDYLTVVFKESVFIGPDNLGASDEILVNASEWLLSVMGFEIGLEKNGRHGYKRSFLMGTEEAKYGFFMAEGAQTAETVCFSFTATGLRAAADGWETRLYEFMAEHELQCKITRIDLAHDFLNGEYTCDQVKQMWEDGLFTTYRNKPQAECIGGDWLLDRGTGRTFQVGTRGGSKIFRFYEKGKEQGDTESPWTRPEVQFRNRDYLLPIEMLIEPGCYFAGAYPALEIMIAKFGETPSRAEVKKKTEHISVEHVLKYASMQASRAVVMLKNYGANNDLIVEMLQDGQKEMPRRLSREAFDCGHIPVREIHKRKKQAADDRAFRELEDYGDTYRQPPRPAPVKKHRSMNEYLKEKSRLERMYSIGFEKLLAQAETMEEAERIKEDRRAFVLMKASDLQGKPNFEREAWKRYWQEQEYRYYSKYATPYEILNPNYSDKAAE